LTLEIADHFRRSPVTIGEAMIRVGKKLVNGRKRKCRISVALIPNPSLSGELSHIGDRAKVGRRGPAEKGNQISQSQNDN